MNTATMRMGSMPHSGAGYQIFIPYSPGEPPRASFGIPKICISTGVEHILEAMPKIGMVSSTWNRRIR